MEMEIMLVFYSWILFQKDRNFYKKDDQKVLRDPFLGIDLDKQR